MLTKEQCLDAFADIQYHMDEPQSNPSSVPLYFLCQLARQHVTVVLSGEGADEIYAGYEWYADTPLMQKYKHIPAPLRHLASDASQHLPYFKGHDFIIKGSGRPEDWFIGQAHVFEEKDAYDILRPKYRVGPTAREVAAPIYDRVKDLSELEKKQYLDLNLWLPGDILLKADKMSMAHSLELRVPYLDREVLREAQTYPDSYKLRGDTEGRAAHRRQQDPARRLGQPHEEGLPRADCQVARGPGVFRQGAQELHERCGGGVLRPGQAHRHAGRPQARAPQDLDCLHLPDVA